MSIESIKDEYASYLDKFSVFERKDQINVSLIVVKREFRGQGIGRKIFNDLIEYADLVKKPIALTPDSSWGMSKANLINFYKSLGFVPNKGRNKDFTISDSMYRKPKVTVEETIMYTKNRFQKLAGILKEEVATYEQLQNWDKPELNLSPTPPDMTKEMLQSYPAWLRAIHLWFHGAHHATRGTGFSGDHVDLYTRIYTEVQNEVDGAVEKIVGLFNDEKLACPRCITGKALEHLTRYESPVELEADQIPSVGLRMIKDYLDYLQNCVDNLEQGGKMTMGLDDQLYASANAHETYVYLLQQRVKMGQ